MSAPNKLTVMATAPLKEEFDLEKRIAAATAEDTLKGMFFQRIVDIATRSGVKTAQIPLRHRPANDRYLAFNDYPVADYFRWVHALGQALHPRVAPSEAMRRVGHADFAEFAASKIGRVTLAFSGNARSTLARSGLLYSMILKGPTVSSDETADGVLIRYRNFRGPVEVYPIGTIESVCRFYETDYSIDISVHGPQDADYFVRLAR
jgi:uncharacterized protein (TIGR02265 family)